MKELTKPDYTYEVTLNRVIDGDTIDVDVDLGFYTKVRKRIRYLELDTEEKRDSDPIRKAKAYEATARTEELLTSADKIYIQTKMDSTGKYGRLLAYVWYEKDGVVSCLNTQMINEGFQKAPKL